VVQENRQLKEENEQLRKENSSLSDEILAYKTQVRKTCMNYQPFLHKSCSTT